MTVGAAGAEAFVVGRLYFWPADIGQDNRGGKGDTSDKNKCKPYHYVCDA